MTERFEDLLLSTHCPPLVICGATTDWPASQWTPEYLADILCTEQVQCKIAPLNNEELLWENECLHITATLSQFVAWVNGEAKGDNPLVPFDPQRFSCYVDYKYMKELFKNQPDVLQSVNWSSCGLLGRDGKDSTIWIGSTGAYTNCHYDSYGFNLVAQIYGRKRWILFPPGQSQCMYPTRIPYEESSVFSEVDLQCPDLKKHPHFQDSTPYIVDLEPGMVLYVPRHWWHYVRCEQSAISINTWVPMEADKRSHLDESITRLLFTSLSQLLMDGTSTSQSSFLNTNEEITPGPVNLKYVKQAVETIKSEHVHLRSSSYSSLSSSQQSISKCESSSTNNIMRDAASQGEVNEGFMEKRNKEKEKSFQHVFSDDFSNDESLKKVAVAFRGKHVQKWEPSCSQCSRCSNISLKRKSDILCDRVENEGKMVSSNEKRHCESSSHKTAVLKSHVPLDNKDLPDDVTDPLQSRDLLKEATSVVQCYGSNVKQHICSTDAAKFQSGQVFKLCPVPCELYLSHLTQEYQYEQTFSTDTKSDLDTGDILRSMLDPQVVQHISEILLHRVIR